MSLAIVHLPGLPVLFGGQLQSNFPTRSIHTPPLRQFGLPSNETQSSKLMEQSTPSHPFMQTQV